MYRWMMDENIDDWIYGCMGSAVTDFNFKFLSEEALALSLAIGVTKPHMDGYTNFHPDYYTFLQIVHDLIQF